jgi:hypothetical protein
MRWHALSGAMFVAAFAAAAVLYGDGAGSDPASISAYYSRPSSWRHQEFGFILLLAGCLFLAHYIAVLRARVATTGSTGTIVVVSGAATVGLLMTGNALWAGTAFFVQIQGGGGLPADPVTHLVVEDTGFALVISAAAAAIPLVLATSWATLRRECLPRWFAALGAATALALAAAYWYVPLALFLLWTATGSVLLSRRPVSI